MVIMALFFALTTPVGIGIGMLITNNKYDENSPTTLVVEGIFNAASAGILIYMALVDFLAADFMHPRMQKSSRLQIWANLSLLLGVGCIYLDVRRALNVWCLGTSLSDALKCAWVLKHGKFGA
ncbi:hypothetical protein RIF29_27298 [Crotalaria pallida]|uniref:Uncharacterized protein n=1 Tax=Crotalaria pallida TaxID=3830 RepID=A0AAN9I284_CROPI